jgi:hypothetical protein
MSDFPTQRIAIVVVQLWQILKVRGTLSNQSAFAKERDFGLRIETVLPGEVVHISHELGSRNADERVFDLAGNVLSHCDDALLAPALMVGTAITVV